jgi:hypothetical protein
MSISELVHIPYTPPYAMNTSVTNITLSNTILTINYAYQAEILFLYSILAILCIFIILVSIRYRKQQPVKSRYILPYIGPAGLLFLCIDKIIVACAYIYDPYIPFTNMYNPTMSFNIVFYTDLVALYIFSMPLLQLAFMLYLYGAVQYFLMKNMYDILFMKFSKKNKHKRVAKKSSEIDMKSINESTKRKLEIYKTLTSRTMMSVVSILFLFTMVIVIVTIRMLPLIPQLSSIITNKLSDQICNYVDIGVRGIFGIALIAVFLWDVFIMSYSKLFKHCAWRQHFLDEDPFRFRIEFVIIFSLILFALMAETLTLSALYATSGKYSDPLYLGLQFASEQPRFLYALCLLASCGGFVCWIKLSTDFKVWNKTRLRPGYLKVDGYVALEDTEESEYELQNTAMFRLLRDPKGYDVFEQFCKVEWSLENLMAWKDLQKILRTYKMDGIDEDRRLDMVKRFYGNYLDSSAKFPLNITFQVHELMNMINEGRLIEDRQIRKALISLNNCLQENLSDSFARLSVTDNYKKYIQTRQLQLQLKTRAEFRSASDKIVEPDTITVRS